MHGRTVTLDTVWDYNYYAVNTYTKTASSSRRTTTSAMNSWSKLFLILGSGVSQSPVLPEGPIDMVQLSVHNLTYRNVYYFNLELSLCFGTWNVSIRAFIFIIITIIIYNLKLRTFRKKHTGCIFMHNPYRLVQYVKPFSFSLSDSKWLSNEQQKIKLGECTSGTEFKAINVIIRLGQ